MKYRLNKYLTIKGVVRQVLFPDSAYGEWIVYDGDKPRYHINIFDNNSKSNCLLFAIINENRLGIEDILVDINNRFKNDFSLSPKSCFGLKIKSELIYCKLESLPFELISHYSDKVNKSEKMYHQNT